MQQIMKDYSKGLMRILCGVYRNGALSRSRTRVAEDTLRIWNASRVLAEERLT